MSRERAMRIGEVAGRAGVPAKTIRFWEDQRLLPPPARTPAGYRDYGPGILERLAFIRQAQAAGLTLAAIGQVLDIRDCTSMTFSGVMSSSTASSSGVRS